MKNTKPTCQTICTECYYTVFNTGTPHIVCPNCGMKLPEVSSEDNDDGEFDADSE
jgi:uncharacterized Zn finger protein (UPF0148 family)